MQFQKELEIAKQAMQKASKKVLEIYNTNFEVAYKEDKSVITKADLASSEIILSHIQSHFPDDGFLSEEVKDDLSRLEKERVWIIDPIDGTKEFVEKSEEFSIVVALTIRGLPVLGLIAAPCLNEIYYATKNQGAYKQKDDKIEKITPSEKTDPLDFKLVKSKYFATSKLLAFLKAAGFNNVVAVGSALKMCHIARGKIDAYYKFGHCYEWDICAADIILKEAGGLLTDLHGNNILYNKKDTLQKGFLASNGKVHDQLVDLVKTTGTNL